MLKEIPKSDIVTRPIKLYKEWIKDHNDIPPIFGENPAGSFVDVDSDDKSHGYVKKIIYASIESQFYRNAATSSVLFEVGKRESYASNYERVLGQEIAVISIPQDYYGEGIKAGSVVLTDSGNVYTDDGNSNLIDGYVTIDGKTIPNVYGNIFYDRGLVVLTKNVVSGSTLSNYSLSYRSTFTIYENEVFLSVLENEFNVSQNPSAVYEDGGRKITQLINRPGSHNNSTELITSSFYDAGVKWIRNGKYPFVSSIDVNKKGSFDDYFVSGSVDPTGSYLAPYITTIGLYDENLDIIAVAKLPQPIKSLPDYPLNFIIRFDT